MRELPSKPLILLAATLLVVGMVVAGCRPRPPARPLQDRDPVFVIPAIIDTAERRQTRRVHELVDLLESEDSAIRFFAIDALRQMTGEDHGFLWWSGDEEQRQQAVERWRRWLKESDEPV